MHYHSGVHHAVFWALACSFTLKLWLCYTPSLFLKNEQTNKNNHQTNKNTQSKQNRKNQNPLLSKPPKPRNVQIQSISDIDLNDSSTVDILRWWEFDCQIGLLWKFFPNIGFDLL